MDFIYILASLKIIIGKLDDRYPSIIFYLIFG